MSAGGAKAASLTNGGTAGAAGPEADNFPRPDFSQMVPFKPKVCPEMEVTDNFGKNLKVLSAVPVRIDQNLKCIPSRIFFYYLNLN